MSHSTAVGFVRRNLANIITLLGFPICFFLLWVVVAHREWMVTILLLVMGVYVTDFADGITARSLKIVSKFGGAVDRLRDKMLLGIMFYFILTDQRVDLWLKVATVPMAFIETLLLAIWYMGVRKKLNVSASWYGQWKMFIMSGGILLCLINILWTGGSFLLVPILLFLFLVACVFGVMSFVTHVSKYRSQLPCPQL